MKSYGINVEMVDPYASGEEFKKEYGIEIAPEAAEKL